MKLIVGLGNPGQIYAHNRHNIGFMCLSHFAKTHGILLDKKQGLARVGTGEVSGEKVVLVRPQTGMNLSGQAVIKLVRRYRLTPDDLIVIHDDLDLPLGKIRIRKGGSSAGHKGINSTIAELGSQDFIRVRVGIGRPETEEGSRVEKEEQVIDHVLSGFTPAEEKTMAEVIPRVGEALLCLLTEGLSASMNKFN